MGTDTNFKVVIVGGGIAGLALANMLERFDLDYILLEKHSSIAPAVGASIGMFPNGLRILDQLDCYKQIQAVFGGKIPYSTSYNRDENGNVTFAINDFFNHLEKRQKLLQILFENLRHKEKVLLNKKFTEVALTDGGVAVRCADGSITSGSFVVGADGVHSAVRNAMMALGNKLQPGYFDPKEPDSVPCYYKCSFGIAQHVPGWITGEQHVVTGKGRSQLVVSGPDDRVYWFMFEKLPETKYGKDIPRYTKEDEAMFVAYNYNTPITTKITFGQVYDKRISSTLTPLHEVVYQKWFFKRIIILGDSTHKPNPIGGQGGNGALESCAELINAILRMKDSRNDSLASLADAEIEKIFQETQSVRHERAKMIVKRAHDMQSFMASENELLSIISKVVPLHGGDEGLFRSMASVHADGAIIEKLAVPYRPHVIPFSNELPAEPINSNVRATVRNAFIGGMGAILLLSLKGFRLPFDQIDQWARSAVAIKWFGDNRINDVFNNIVAVLAALVRDPNPSGKVHLWNFFPQLISPLLIYNIEGSRRAHLAGPLSLPSLFSVGMQLNGIGRIAPLYAILSAFSSADSPAARAVPLEFARSLIPAVTLGFLIPTVMSLLPNPNIGALNAWHGLWQFAPPFFNVLSNIISRTLRRYESIQPNKPSEKHQSPENTRSAERYRTDDIPLLKTVYTFAFAVQATAHITSIAYAWHHPDVSLASTFFELPNPFRTEWNLPTLYDKLATFLKYDMILAVAAIVGSNLYSVWNLRSLGYIKTGEAVRAAVGIIVGQFAVGSGATWAGLWYWREEKLASSASFPGPWDKFNFAPPSRYVTPRTILSMPKGEVISEFDNELSYTLNGTTPELVFDFGYEVGGIISLSYELMEQEGARLGLAFTEAKNYIGRLSDSSSGNQHADGALNYDIADPGAGIYTMPDQKLRGGFRYLTLFLATENSKPLTIQNISLEISFQPTWSDMRAYQGYFNSGDELLNRIWYSGAYTLQTNSVPSYTGRVPTSRLRGGWQNDAYIGPGGTVLLDGAKRDRWVWIGDMGTAVPSAFVSTGDMESTKNALLAIFDNQSDKNVLPKAGPPYVVHDSDTYHMWTLIGAYNYILYTGDTEFVEAIWDRYVNAVEYSLGLIGSSGIMSVVGAADWGRWTYSNERASANMLLYRSLRTGADIAGWLPDLAGATALATKWTTAAEELQKAIMNQFWDDAKGAFKESPENTSLYPQDGNSMAIAFGVVEKDSKIAKRVSDYLKSNWTPIGASCPELKNNVSPFISSIELISHFRAGHADRAVQLMRDAWGWYINHPNGTESTTPEGYLLDGRWTYRADRGYRNDPTYMSHAHGWSSGPTSSLTEYLVGLRVTRPAGEEWQFVPEAHVDGLEQAEAGFTTKLGKFSAKFRVEGNKIHLEWDSPEGTKGWIALPGRGGEWVDGGKGSKGYCL
ncbi:FAD-dependent monooxygenase adrH [Paramyrothecium foliicola]|nr:FAD-dependent monooxygenase adrH [Paramyrothecium foliicola]